MLPTHNKILGYLKKLKVVQKNRKKAHVDITTKLET